MSMRGQLFFALAAFFMAALLFEMTQAEIWERSGKSQRSTPSLRLRFGRSASDLLTSPSAEKRWFGGDVNQKPIRSPSLRLRFGRRSDPSLRSTDHLPGRGFDGDDFDGSAFQRVLRKAQLRLRFGRNAPPKFWTDNQVDDNQQDDETSEQNYDALLTDLLNVARLRRMLLALRGYEDERDDESDEFQREARKPAPLRLRFGRSAIVGHPAAASSSAVNENNEQKNPLTSESINNKD